VLGCVADSGALLAAGAWTGVVTVAIIVKFKIEMVFVMPAVVSGEW
jgi:hypothetical protein